jgi:flagellar basal-body rod protein FlgC
VFDSISTSGTGLNTYQVWLDTIANNVANANDVTTTSGQAFRAQYIVAQPIAGGADGVGQGVAPTQAVRLAGNGIVTHEPTNPLADANGDVRHADVNISEQMTDMIAAERAYQANASTIDRAKEAYEAAIAIGKGL